MARGKVWWFRGVFVCKSVSEDDLKVALSMLPQSPPPQGPVRGCGANFFLGGGQPHARSSQLQALIFGTSQKINQTVNKHTHQS